MNVRFGKGRTAKNDLMIGALKNKSMLFCRKRFLKIRVLGEKTGSFATMVFSKRVLAKTFAAGNHPLLREKSLAYTAFKIATFVFIEHLEPFFWFSLFLVLTV